MEFKASQIAEMIGGKLYGNPEATVSEVCKIEEGVEGAITFLASEAYIDYIYQTKASIALVNDTFQLDKPVPDTLTIIRTDDARMAFTKLLSVYAEMLNKRAGISAQAYIDSSSKIGRDVFIGAGAVIESGAEIGDGAQIYPNTVIGEGATVGAHSVIYSNVSVGKGCRIGAHCMLQPGVIVGGDGFGFAPNRENQYHKVPHLGNVIIEDHVEIGANTSIDRATMGSTIIRKGVKLDNLIQVAHNVEIGENTVIAAQTGIAGSTKIGRDCMIGGQVGIVGHLTIADEVKIAAQSGIGQSISTKGTIVQGSPALPIRDFKRSYVVFKNLPDLAEKLNELSNAKST